MKQHLLLPNRFKKIGWLLLVPATIIGIYITVTGTEFSWLNAKVFALFNDDFLSNNNRTGIIKVNLTNTITGVLFITGALLVGFTKEKAEDEYIASLRLSSLMWAVWVSCILLLLAFIFVYGSAFFTVMVYNMFTHLIIFIARFNYLLLKNKWRKQL